MNAAEPIPEDEYLLVMTTFPDLETARQIGTTLVHNQLIACVNLFKGGVESIFTWNGEIQVEEEFPAFFKTTRSQLEKLKETLLDLHPYDVPEIIVLPITDGSTQYLKWMSGCCKA